MSRQLRGFVSGFALAGVLFGGWASAANIVQREIQVSYLPLRYMFEGNEKTPPADQQGFTLNGRTYVPLRFMAESMGKSVEYDAETYTIWLGRRPAAVPSFWTGFSTVGEAIITAEYYEQHMLSLRGQPMPKAVVLNALHVGPADPVKAEIATNYVLDMQRDPNHTTMSGTLFLPDAYFGQTGKRNVGYLVVTDENNNVLYKSDTLSEQIHTVPFTVKLGLTKKLKLTFVFFHNQGFAAGDSMLSTQIGVSDLRFE